jgi:transcriptional regulator with PAS, ATPase and Fis domain
MVVSSSEKVTPIPVKDDTHPIIPKTDIADADIIEAPDYEEETLSLQDVEKDMIIKALERHNGKRKNAAQDLKISERTLYRKIKEYNLEDL